MSGYNRIIHAVISIKQLSIDTKYHYRERRKPIPHALIVNHTANLRYVPLERKSNVVTDKVTANSVYVCGPGISVGIATGYGLDVRGSNPGEGEIFHTSPDGPWGPPNLLYNGYRIFLRGKERPGRDADPTPPSSAVVMKG